MTKKDYELIARAIGKVMEVASEDETRIVDTIINTLSEALKHDNPRFDGTKFRAKCWSEGGIDRAYDRWTCPKCDFEGTEHNLDLHIMQGKCKCVTKS